MKNPIIANIEEKQLKEDVPLFNVGDKVKVHSKITEGNKTRIQAFEGTVIKINRAGVKTNFTVRKVVATVGVEKTFILHSPNVQNSTICEIGLEAKRPGLKTRHDRGQYLPVDYLRRRSRLFDLFVFFRSKEILS